MSTETLRLAAAQISSGSDPTENLRTIEAEAARAAEAGARLVAFPEASMACFGTDLPAIAEPLDGAFATGVRACAERLGVTLVVGMFEPADDGRVHNTLLATGGGVEASYRKIHLFDAFGSRESDLVAPGSDLVTIDVDGVSVGLATCYDLRFADQFTALGRAGAQVVVVPASWGDGPGKEGQWDLLTRSRAMDAQAFLLACDQAWRHAEGTDPLGVGRSCLVDPLGVVRDRLDQAAGLLLGDADPQVVADVRARVPIL